MTHLSSRAPRKPNAALESQIRATLVFRDFVRQLERLAAPGAPLAAKAVREGSR
jgi:hypothetical protein